MGSFRDTAVARLADAAALAEALAPSAEFLVEQSYVLEHARLESVRSVTVRSLRVEEPVFPATRHAGSWTAVGRSPPERTEFLAEGRADAPVWIDLLAGVEVEVVAEVDPGGLASLVVAALDDFRTLEEFRDRFRFLDLDAFMAAHGLATVEDLREAGQYLRAEIRLRKPAEFDPADPANRRTARLRVAVLVADPADVTGAIRAARLVSASAGAPVPPPDELGEHRAPYAMAAVFPRVGAEPPGPTEQEITRLLAGAGIAALFIP
ncbi:hypothetical protein [Spirillospora sp. NPDC029432]|uniref:hypothetical protein n=1 Tax=Spirillospora sp. NPDC029432 TaxID=3154599 RepID=UPI003454C690